MIDLVGKRYLFLAASLLVIIPGVIAILLGGLKPGLDFTGGTRWELTPLNALANNTESFKTALTAAGYKETAVRGGQIGTAPNITDTIIIDLPGQIDAAEQQNIEQHLIDAKLVPSETITESVSVTDTSIVTGTVTAASGTPSATGTISGTGTVTASGTTTGTTGTTGTTPPATKTVTRQRIPPSAFVNSLSVGPTIGNELVGRAMLAIGLASLAILIYLTLVFRKVPNAFRYGVCAIIALLHDVLVVLGIFAILGFVFGVEIDSLFITALMTIIGFSVHDTIVVFDRVRENIVRRRFERFQDIVNYSLVQTLARSINTSITVLLTLFALYLFGGASIRNFVLALLIGIISGTYSSIFNASMLLVIWENREWTTWFGRGRPSEVAPTSTRATAR